METAGPHHQQSYMPICICLGCEWLHAQLLPSVAGLAVPATTSWLHTCHQAIASQPLTIFLSILLCTFNDASHAIQMSLLQMETTVVVKHRC